MISGNGSSFTSDEFVEFIKNNGIIYTPMTPYHPSLNGQVERYVQTVKNCLKKLDEIDIILSMSRFLLENPFTSHSVSDKTSAELMFGWPFEQSFT